MKYFNLISLLLVFSIFSFGCVHVGSLRSNSFEAKYPIAKCKRKIQVLDPEPKVEIGKFISSEKAISLLTPYINLTPTNFVTDLESAYLTKVTDDLGDRIENQFLVQNWVERVIPADIKQLSADTTTLPLSVSRMMAHVLENDTIDYGNWNAPAELIVNSSQEYSLLLLINGSIGFDGVMENENYFYLFLIDNEAGKVSYADFFKYHCDVRNTDGLIKVMDYAYLKLLNVRFKEEETID